MASPNKIVGVFELRPEAANTLYILRDYVDSVDPKWFDSGFWVDAHQNSIDFHVRFDHYCPDTIALCIIEIILRLSPYVIHPAVLETRHPEGDKNYPMGPKKKDTYETEMQQILELARNLPDEHLGRLHILLEDL